MLGLMLTHPTQYLAVEGDLHSETILLFPTDPIILLSYPSCPIDYFSCCCFRLIEFIVIIDPTLGNF